MKINEIDNRVLRELAQEIHGVHDKLDLPEKQKGLVKAQSSSLMRGASVEEIEEILPGLIENLEFGNVQAKEFASKLKGLLKPVATAKAEQMPTPVITSPVAVQPEAKSDVTPTPTPVQPEQKSDATQVSAKPGRKPGKAVAEKQSKAAQQSAAKPSPVKSTDPGIKSADRPKTVADVFESTVRLRDLQCSRWNRSYGMEPDLEYIKGLAADIKVHDLMHPASLVLDKDGNLRVIAGWNRILALMESRGPDGCLRPGEYRIITNLTEENPECLAYSVAENHLRRESSPYQQACYVQRLISKEGITQEKAGEALHLNRVIVNKLLSLAEHFDSLPESWQLDLKCKSTYISRRILRGHWEEAASVIKKYGVTPDVVGILEKAHVDNLSVRQLSTALAGLRQHKTKTPPEVTAPQDTPEQPQISEPVANNPLDSVKLDDQHVSVSGKPGTVGRQQALQNLADSLKVADNLHSLDSDLADQAVTFRNAILERISRVNSDDKTHGKHRTNKCEASHAA